MAEGTSINSKLVCPFFKSNSCRYGDKCHLLHDSTSHASNVVCAYFLKGSCRFGDNCWNVHSEPGNKSMKAFKKQTTVSFAPSKASKPLKDSISKSGFEVIPEKMGPGPSRLISSDSNVSYDDKPCVRPSNSRKLTPLWRKTEVPMQGLCAPYSPDWVHAPEFIPRNSKSYADTLKTHLDIPQNVLVTELCPLFINDCCPYDEQCAYVHGDICELCGKASLHPQDDLQRKLHTDFCEKELEKDMELAFAMQRSQEKVCGICMDIVLEKDPPSERRFGILEKCNHVFCLSCIRKWRSVKQLEGHFDISPDSLVTRSCPECRVTSNFITPSQYWHDSEEDKKKLITDYKIAMSQKKCKYFQGNGNCPFGGSCFYLHVKADGTKVDLPPPRRRRQNQDGELDFVDRILLWDFLELREESILMQFDVEDFLQSLSTFDDESDSSDNILSESL